MAMELSPDAQRWLSRLPEIANVVLIALVALAAAHLFWLFWPQPTAEASAPADAQDSTRASERRSVDINTIAGAHLFGQQPVVDVDRERQKELNAPETHLNLTLTGIIADSQGDRSRALIKNAKGDQDSYHVDQSIASGVKLHAIYADRVILDRGGRYETLTLESLKKAQAMAGVTRQPTAGSTTTPATASAASEDTGSQTVDGALGEQLASVRQKILADPSSAQRYIRLRPAREDGNLVGYRIFPGQDKSLFQKAGLKSGELVTAINGQPLNNPAASLKLLGNLAQAPSATVTVKNGSQTRTVHVDFQ